MKNQVHIEDQSGADADPRLNKQVNSTEVPGNHSIFVENNAFLMNYKNTEGSELNKADVQEGLVCMP